MVAPANIDTVDLTRSETVLVEASRQEQLPQPAPSVLGRYVVLEEVGRGGMGRVYRAYDPRLDRVVALKCLRLDLPEERQADGAGRIIREARLMARLSHPNVVPVYDVEQAGDILFVAMEFVAGTTLWDWLETKRGLREILAMLTDAGRGLAAAHDAGIVHRDFKSSNVMIGRDGRARVMDFGISRVSEKPGEPELASELRSDLSPGLSAPDDLRTAVGQVVGTPRYMAPEQHAGGPTDARSDQYSFCLVLFEAIYGCRPYPARDYRTLLEQKQAGAPTQPARRGVPRRVIEVIARGLSPDPRLRWSSMHTLVERLAPPLALRPAHFVALAAAIGIVAPVGYLVGHRASTDACNADEVLGQWTPQRRASVRDAVAGSGGVGTDNAERVISGLDAYVEALASVVEHGCDPVVLASAGVAARNASAGCVEHARTAMVATIDLLGRPGPSIGPRALDAVLALPDPQSCIDLDRLRTEAPTPDDPDTAIEVRRLRNVFAQAKVLEDVGEFAAGLDSLRSQREAVDAADFRPLEAEFLLRQGALLRRNGDYIDAIDSLRRGYFMAVTCGHDGVALAAATQLVEVVGAQQADFEADEVWIDQGRAWVERVDPGGLEDARFVAAVAAVDGARGRYSEARKGFERASALLDAAGRGDHPEAAALHDALGGVRQRQGDLEAAEIHHARALAIRERVLGLEHPDVATTLDNLGIIAKERGRASEAIDLHTRALAIREATLGPEHPDVASTLVNLGTALEHGGELEAARARLEQAAALIERALGPNHPRLGAAEGNLGNVEYALRHWPEALAHYQRAAAIFRIALGEEHPDVAMAHNNVGLVALQLGRHQLARTELETALGAWEKTLGPDHPHIAMVLTNLGENSHATGQDRDAAIQLARARKILLAVAPEDGAALFEVMAMLGAAHAAVGEDARAIEVL